MIKIKREKGRDITEKKGLQDLSNQHIVGRKPIQGNSE